MARKSAIDQAAEWFVELDTAERIEDKWDGFEKWLAENPEHERAFSDFEDDWLLAQLLDPVELSPPRRSATLSLLNSIGRRLLRWFGFAGRDLE